MAATVTDLLVDLATARDRTLALVAHLDDDALERAGRSADEPARWDLAHIAAYEDLWIAHRHGGRDLLQPELAALYDAFETPRAVRGEIELLGADGARAYLADVRDAHASAAAERDGRRRRSSTRWSCATSSSTPRRCARRCASAALLAAGRAARCGRVGGRRRLDRRPRPARSRWAPPATASPTTTSARATRVELRRFRIARRPVTQRELAALHRGRRLRAPRVVVATRAGRGRRSTTSRTVRPQPQGTRTRPCATSPGSRPTPSPARTRRDCPTEAEWERAATWSQTDDAPPSAASGSGPPARFGGYPGFRAYPYREYSEVFFGDDYRVLRGGSWATHPRVAHHRRSATGTCPSGARSSPACAWPSTS